MKKLSYLLILCLLCTSLCACNKDKANEESATETVIEETTESTEESTESTEETPESSEELLQTATEESVEESVVEESVEPEIVYEEVKPFILYITGIDVWGWVGKQSRSDVNLLLTVNPQTHQILMVSTPRDFYVPLSISNGAKDKLTHAGLYGTQCSQDTIAMLYNVNVDYNFRCNFSGFEAIIDHLGGVDVWTDYDFTVEPIKHYVKGENHLTGLEALAFVRERHAFKAGDRVRGIHQMETAKSVLEHVFYSDWLNQYENLANDLAEFYETTMPFTTLQALAEAQIKDGAHWDIRTYSSDGKGTSGVTYSGGSKALSVIEPNYDTVNEATRLMNGVLEGQLLSDLMGPEETTEE